MAYVTFEYFNGLHDDVDEREFNALEWSARRIIDAHTTGIDNVRKLRKAFPTDEDDEEAIKRCMCALIKFLHDIETVERNMQQVQRPDGTITSGPVASASSGTESISYASSGNTAIEAAARDITMRNKLIVQMVRENLSGICDANGVCLLYMGRYPNVR